jgi:hypothetical protein
MYACGGYPTNCWSEREMRKKGPAARSRTFFTLTKQLLSFLSGGGIGVGGGLVGIGVLEIF